MSEKKKMVGDVKAVELLDELKRLHEEYPTIRVGRLLQSAVDTRKKQKNFDLNNVSTKEMLTSVREFKQLLKSNMVRVPKKNR